MSTHFLFIALLSLAASTNEDPQKPTPQEASKIAGDPIWGRPLTYLDFILHHAAEKLRPRIEHISTSSNNGLFILNTPVESPGEVASFIDPKTKRALIIIGLRFKKALKSHKEICSFFLRQATHDLGANSDPSVRDNVLSTILPPSAHALPQEEITKANDRLMENLDFIVKIYELETRQSSSCIKPILASDFTISTGKPRRTGEVPAKD
ncbi:hypothetical protein [Myxococcus sp. Y35]|uniref:hypothetical protein n=1 Tax=Pseudomyxococcus flavus TaxID=3115648 RepID=UPI003CF5FEBE